MFLQGNGGKLPNGIVRMMVLDGLHQLAQAGDVIAMVMIDCSRLLAASGAGNESECEEKQAQPAQDDSETVAPVEPPAQFAKPQPATRNYDWIKRGSLNN